ncbi:MAG: putative selenium-dependent hydroxylase accessory protein YqeC [Spirochaetia bacterium]|nr:putative selenium-dependent hydroxylase accessory protein YqeC [Spirochaetia bacterium]
MHDQLQKKSSPVAPQVFWWYGIGMQALLSQLTSLFRSHETCICITGSGGKTTALIALADVYAREGKKVLVSTTTKLQLPGERAYGCDHYFFTDEEVLSHTPQQGERVFFALKGEYKALAPDLQTLGQLLCRYDAVLLEADGARRCNLKLHTERDPVIPSFATATLAVASLAAWGKPLDEECFGCEAQKDQLVAYDTYAYLLAHSQGICKGMQGTAVVLLNQADTLSDNQRKTLQKLQCTHTLLIGSLEKDTLYPKD